MIRVKSEIRLPSERLDSQHSPPFSDFFSLLRSISQKICGCVGATPFLVCFKAGYIDAWGRGIEKMTHACESAGLPTPTFESNSGGVLATFTLHPASVGPVDLPKSTTTQVEAQVELSETDKKIISLLDTQTLGQSQIMALLGYTTRTGNFKRALERLSALALIEMTIPDKPNSRLQKYRLTEKFRKKKLEE